MVVSITWSASQSGSAISSPLNWGNINVGANSTGDIFISHNGTEKIYDCSFYIAAYSGSYVGGADPATDLAELQAWGDAGDGFAINQDLTGGFGTGTWVTHTTSAGTVSVPIMLDKDSQISGPGSADGEIAVSVKHHVKLRITVPSSEDTAGTRMFDQVFKFTYTS